MVGRGQGWHDKARLSIDSVWQARYGVEWCGVMRRCELRQGRYGGVRQVRVRFVVVVNVKARQVRYGEFGSGPVRLVKARQGIFYKRKRIDKVVIDNNFFKEQYNGKEERSRADRYSKAQD